MSDTMGNGWARTRHWGGSMHLVRLADLRPGWRWSALSNEWMIKGAPSGAGGSSGAKKHKSEHGRS